MMPLAVRLDDLGAVVEINLVTVVVRRVVAGGDDDAGAGAQMSNRKGKLRRRTRPVEDTSIAAIFRRDPRRQLGERFREKARVVRDHDLWFCSCRVGPGALMEISDQALGGAADVEEIHRVGADARKLRRFVRGGSASLARGHDFSDGASA